MNKAKTATETKTITAWKAFDADFKCRGFQYEVGKTYKIKGDPVICERGFHACQNPFDVWNYYDMLDSRYAEVELTGETVDHDEDSKIAGAEITIKAELKLPDFIKSGVARLVDWITSKADSNIATGDRGHAAATGKYGIAAALGYAGTAMAHEGGAIMLAAWDNDWKLVAVFASKVGENGIEVGKAYRLGLDGKPAAA